MSRVNTKRLHKKPPRSATRPRQCSNTISNASTSGIYHVQFGLFELLPGSPIARALGCSCPQHDGTEMFSCDRECSIHGLELLMSALDETSAGAFEFDRT